MINEKQLNYAREKLDNLYKMVQHRPLDSNTLCLELIYIQDALSEQPIILDTEFILN